MMELREAIEVRVEGWRGGNLPKHTWIRPPRCHRNCPCTRGGVRRRTRRAVRRSPGRRTRRHIRHGKSAADVFLETVTQPFLGFLTAFYRAHPAKRPFDARMVVPVDVIVYQDEHLITGTFLPMLGIDGFRLHAPEESLRGAVRRMTLLRFCKLASTVGLACFVGLVIDPITTDHAIRPSIPRRSMTAMPELRLDSLVPVPDHVVVGHVDEPVQRDAREAAFAEELLLEPVLAPHPQRTPAGVAELPDRVRSAAFVCDVQAHGPVVLLPAALRHKGSSSRSGSPRKRHHLEASTSI